MIFEVLSPEFIHLAGISSLQWVTLLTIVGAALIILVLPYYACQRHLQARVDEVSHQRDFIKTLLNQTGQPLCWWLPGHDHIHYSETFGKLFDLKPDRPVTWADVVNHFSPDAAVELSQALNKLGVSHVPFEMTLQTLTGNFPILLTGNYIPHTPQGYATLSAQPISGPSPEETIAALESERDLFRQMLDNLPVALWYRNDEGRIVFCNAVYAGLVDSTPDQVKREGHEWVPQERRHSPYHLAIKARTTKLKQTAQQHMVIDGSRRLIEFTELPLEKETSLGFALDLTEIEETRDEMQQHIKAYQEILQKLSTPVALYGPDTRLQFFNQTYCKLFEFDEAWLYSRPDLGEILEDLRERRKLPEQQNFPVYKKERLAQFNNLMQQQEFLIHQPDGQIFRTLVAPHPLGGLIYLFEDVTDKLSLEQRFNTLMAVQRETLEHLHEGIAVLGSDYRLRLANPALLKIWQLDTFATTPDPHATDLLEGAKHLFSSEAEAEDVYQRFLNTLNQRIPRQSRIRLVDERVIQTHYIPLPDGSHLFSFVDITDSTRFEQALQERNQALEQAARLKSDFISNVSYELRAPLNTVIGFTEMLTNQYFGSLNERQMDYLRTILESGQRLLSLINDMIDLASIEAGQLALSQQPIHLPTFLNSTMSLIYHRANDQGLEMISENHTNLDIFIADERRLKQALFNLLMNSIKFTPAGGTIRLIAETSPDEQQLWLTVADTGVGISPDDQARLFKLFESTPSLRARKQSGVGLGLPLVKSLIELHGGTLHIQSTPGQGTQITCRVPLTVVEEAAIPLKMNSPESTFIGNEYAG